MAEETSPIAAAFVDLPSPFAPLAEQEAFVAAAQGRTLGAAERLAVQAAEIQLAWRRANPIPGDAMQTPPKAES